MYVSNVTVFGCTVCERTTRQQTGKVNTSIWVSTQLQEVNTRDPAGLLPSPKAGGLYLYNHGISYHLSSIIISYLYRSSTVSTITRVVPIAGRRQGAASSRELLLRTRLRPDCLRCTLRRLIKAPRTAAPPLCGPLAVPSRFPPAAPRRRPPQYLYVRTASVTFG